MILAASQCASCRKEQEGQRILLSEARKAWPKTGVQRADSGVGFLGRVKLARGFVKHCTLPQQVLGQSLCCSTLFLYFEVSRQLLLLRYQGQTAAEVPQSGSKAGVVPHPTDGMSRSYQL